MTALWDAETFGAHVENFFLRYTISSGAFKFPLRTQKPVTGTLF